MSHKPRENEVLSQAEDGLGDQRIAKLTELLNEIQQDLPDEEGTDRINRLLELAFPFLVQYAKSPKVIFRDYSPGSGAKQTDSIVQRATLKLWTKLKRRQLKGWTGWGFLGLAHLELMRIASEVAKRERKLAELLQEKLERDGLPPIATSPSAMDDLICSQEDSIILNQAVYALPIEYREPIQLYFFEELTMREVGKRLNVPTTTINSRLKTACGILGRTILQPQEP